MFHVVYNIGTSSTPNATWGTYYANFGVIQSERSRKGEGLSVEPPMGFDSADCDVSSNDGASRQVTLIIRKICTSVANLKTFLNALDSLIDGDQTTINLAGNTYPFNYVSDRIGTIKVKVQSVDWRVNIAESPTETEYTLVLIESGTLV